MFASLAKRFKIIWETLKRKKCHAFMFKGAFSVTIGPSTKPRLLCLVCSLLRDGLH